MNKNAKYAPMTKLTEVRKARKLSMRELGELTGLNRQTIYQYEAGLRSPTVPNVQRLARALKVSTSDII